MSMSVSPCQWCSIESAALHDVPAAEACVGRGTVQFRNGTAALMPP
jgi:hypothetical protein